MRLIYLFTILLLPISVFIGDQHACGQNTTDSVETSCDFDRFTDTLDFYDLDFSLINHIIFHLTNEVRKEYGLSQLKYNKHLQTAAANHSKLMAGMSFFSHTNPYDFTRKTASDRAALAGITNPIVSENLALNYIRSKDTYFMVGKRIIEQWMASPPHRQNILTAEAVQIGCGCYVRRNSIYATQLFQLFEQVAVVENPDENIVVTNYLDAGIIEKYRNNTEDTVRTARYTPVIDNRAINKKDPKFSHDKSNHQYFLIVGSFDSHENAKNYVRTLKKKNFRQSEILTGSSYHRVSLCSFHAGEEARVKKAELKTTFPGIWILTNPAIDYK